MVGNRSHHGSNIEEGVMNSNLTGPIEIEDTLSDLRRRISRAVCGLLRNRLLVEAEAVNLELYRGDLTSSRRFHTIESAIGCDQYLAAIAAKMERVPDSPQLRAA
jgi:hypothetical protein